MKQSIHSSLRPSPATGFLLVTVVVMLAVTTLMMTGLASRSMNEASVAVAEEREMRTRWATTTVRRFVLNRADQILERERASDGQLASMAPSTIRHKSLQLGGRTWQIILADESAKLNLRSLAARGSVERVYRLAPKLISGQKSLVLLPRERLNPSSGTLRWEHWLAGERVDDPTRLAEETQFLTLWGDGRLNVRNCSSDVLSAVWRELFGRSVPESIWNFRANERADRLVDLTLLAGMGEQGSAKVRRWMKAESDAYSLWVFCKSDPRIRPALFVKWGNARAPDHRGYLY
ncbi:hypothetical protein V7x_40610 [Crateriforma conspicua]|uniref:General secretion pathway protein K n=1 Tax=Crateriforma conspicua TaxID=2527996 RepID=A0A5C6FMF9_9PLAN|nr:hypothetical protein [Crateriforma conspicua]TWU62332.1 hypothetical protein V7x_40610 [Crateriforma conspicua]